jgi:glycosyltransferase XagB
VTPRSHGPNLPDIDLLADRTLSRGQRRVFLAAGAVVLVALVLAPRPTMIAFMAVATVLYLAVLVDRVLLLWAARQGSGLITVTEADARAVPDHELPVYTILIPAYHEPAVIPALLDALADIEYPVAALDVRLLLEEDDAATYHAAVAAGVGNPVEIVFVPPSEPRTKPKACNVGLLEARGEFVTIYDVEDRPDPLQLRRAVVAFSRVPPEVACLQAKLSYHNAHQNLITRWFAAEYIAWFQYLLPGLVQRDVPIPLGGTSNHFRREVLQKLAGWDPWNVTEDADLGLRLHRFGLRTRMLDSVTDEEANSDFVNWVKQRSRWYKGYLQTWLVHMRQPRRLYREVGLKGFLNVNLFVGGTPLFAVLNPLFWTLNALWFIGRVKAVETLFPTPVYYGGLLCLVLGNALFLYSTLLICSRARMPSLVIAALFTPLYWGMMALAGWKAIWQLVTAPSFWEKTVHGLDHGPHHQPARAGRGR